MCKRIAESPSLLREVRPVQRLRDPAGIEIFSKYRRSGRGGVGIGRGGDSRLRAPCRVAVPLSGPTRVTGHGRRLTTPVDMQLRGTDATERQARHFG
ncbi:hypothetical protein SBRY_30627 [Actinacidiphila bryophytorum]|uniref:Uncharacterized protein n=1 Tax=Actinacidiphila bryophytorum TaxID=1436133 RepID=A0A9W4H1H5_9ACTN|nr:hypothetical protein SBRY_30627 [Actinacidiphila bryophytorum]